ncbi:YtxH domain-containing protein [Microbacterium sp. P06]|uniref:YtxH domain-containing protein n=1 Tax=unclassified Microbacterium TaxID=2609290 RepID=UPI003745DD19
MAPEPEYAPPAAVSDEIETVSVRRAPKYSVFIIIGAALGIVAAMILTFAFSGTSEASPNTGIEYAPMQVFGFIVLICVPIGIAIGGAVALLFDRTVGRRTREVRVDHERVQLTD